MIEVNDKNLGHATAYSYAVSKGYEGTEEEFAELMASYATVAVAAEASAKEAEGFAVGEEDGTPVQEGSPYYQNNAKYYNDEAGQSAQASADSAGSSETDALKSEGFAVGKQNGTPVQEDSPYYHNNAEYFSDNADSSAQAASNSAGAANTDALKSEGFAVGQQNGTDVTDQSPYYHNSAKYYKEQAAASAGSILGLTAEGTVDANVGTPQVNIEVSDVDNHKKMTFAFMNMKGEPGVSVVVTVTDILGGHRVTLTDYQGDHTFDVMDGEVTMATLEQILEDYARVNGYYEDLTAGSAEQLISSVAISDNAPYNFRTSGGSVDIGDRETDKLVGGTVAWNQLVNKTEIASTTTDNGITFTNNGDGSVTVSGTASATARFTIRSAKTWDVHKYLLYGCPSGGDSGTYSLRMRGQGGDSIDVGSGVIWNASGNQYKGIVIQVGNGTEIISAITFRPQFIDLTQMFGSAIADHIYALETANAGDGVAWFRKYFPKDYYAYNAGELLSVKTSEHRMTGFNQWDEEWEKGGISTSTGGNIDQERLRSKNYIPLIVGKTYNFHNGPMGNVIIFFYDSNKTFTGYSHSLGTSSDVQFVADYPYVRFVMPNITTYSNNICINLHWDGERDGEYEAYKEHSYALDPDLELRGILNLDANDELYYDGDIYESDGTVTRKYGIIDLGTLNWDYNANYTYPYFSSNEALTLSKKESGVQSVVCQKYVGIPNMKASSFRTESGHDKQICLNTGTSQNYLILQDTSFTDASNLKSALSGVYLVYELQNPNSEQADPYTNPQIVDDWGTEEYVDTRDVQIPVGHETLYQANLKAKLEMAPNSPSDGDGDYIVRQTNGENAYVKLVKELPVQPDDTVDYALKSNSGSLSWQKYDEMIVGNAKQLISSVGIEDQVPYNFRTSGGSNDIGTLEEDTIVGGTLVWNQLIQNGNFANTTGISAYAGTIAVSNNTLAFTVTDVSGSVAPQIRYSRRDFIVGHKYFFTFKLKPAHSLSSKTFCYLLRDSGSTNYNISGSCDVTENVWNNINKIVYINPTTASGSTYGTIQFTFCMTSANGYAVNDISYLKDLMFIDLTQMFGTSIANYIYALETANAGDGVAWFKKLFPKPYYAYNAGELMSVKTSAHQMTRFNQWDEEWEEGTFNTTNGANLVVSNQIRSKNIIKILPNTRYFWKSPVYNWVIFYDANGKIIETPPDMDSGSTSTSGNSRSVAANHAFTTPDNAYGMRFYTGTYYPPYKNNICINLHWDGERDGEYEPYELISYPLDSDLELKGIPKLDASNNLYYDGDIYEPDGTVTRRYGVVDLGTLTWYADTNRTGVFYTPSISSTAKANGSIITRDYSFRSLDVPNPSSIANYNKLISLALSYGGGYIYIIDHSFDTLTPAEVKSALSGNYAVYELKDSAVTTEEADPYITPQMVDDWGTEEYVDTRDVPIPVGHKTFYQANLKAKLEMAPDSPGDGDGLYAVRQTDGENSYEKIIFPTELPAAPTTDGSYRLKVTVTNGTPVLSWESIS